MCKPVTNDKLNRIVATYKYVIAHIVLSPNVGFPKSKFDFQNMTN